jgi:hypothetical protein
LSLLLPELAGRDFVRSSVELQIVINYLGFSFVYQIPFDDQLALFALFGSDLIRRDELLAILGPDGSGFEGGGS